MVQTHDVYRDLNLKQPRSVSVVLPQFIFFCRLILLQTEITKQKSEICGNLHFHFLNYDQ